MEDLIISAIYEKEETSPKQAIDLREKAFTVLHYSTTGLTPIVEGSMGLISQKTPFLAEQRWGFVLVTA
ncbi:MAG: hypothetical protein KKE57_07980 [Proteobacteria bacterium]|nr:hypothetical protein [Pseudomonadota bacterium]